MILASIMLLGSLTGAIGGALQSGQFGRKGSLMIDAALFVISTVALSLAPNLIVVLASRFVQGKEIPSILYSRGHSKAIAILKKKVRKS